MGFFSDIFGIGKGISAVEAVGNLVTKYHSDTIQAKELKEQLEANADVVEAEIAKIEAASSNWFVSGARPFILWVCGIALAFYLIPQHVVTAWVWSLQVARAGALVPYPDSPQLVNLVIATLGLGGMHMVENLFGKSK